MPDKITPRISRSELTTRYKQGTDKVPVRLTTDAKRGWRTPWSVIRTASLPLLLNTEPLFIEGTPPSFDITPVREVAEAHRVNPHSIDTVPIKEVTSAKRRR